MKLLIQNRNFHQYATLLKKYTGKKRQARALARFLILLETKLEVIEQEKFQLFSKYCHKDEFGHLVLTEKSEVSFLPEKEEEGLKELHELLNDQSIVDVTEFENYLDDFVALLETEELALTSDEAIVYDCLLEDIEKISQTV